MQFLEQPFEVAESTCSYECTIGEQSNSWRANKWTGWLETRKATAIDKT